LAKHSKTWHLKEATSLTVSWGFSVLAQMWPTTLTCCVSEAHLDKELDALEKLPKWPHFYSPTMQTMFM
jgi:hypothetical protein